MGKLEPSSPDRPFSGPRLMESRMGKLELVMETDKVSIYSPKYSGEAMTEFEFFLSNNKALPQPQLKNDFDAIISTLNKMQSDCGARENLFRLEVGRIKAIPLFIAQRTIKNLGTVRLYCIRLSNRLLIIGNGGVKLVRKYEEDTILSAIVDSLRRIEHKIFLKARSKHIDYEDFDGIKHIIETLTI